MAEKEIKKVQSLYEVKDVVTQTEKAIVKDDEIITTQEAIAKILNIVEEISKKLG